MKIHRALSCGAIALILSLVAPIEGRSQEDSRSWEDRAASADRIVVGRCIDQWSEWVDGRIYTFSELELEDTLRGEPAATTTIRQPGGIVGEIGQRVSHVRLLQGDRDYLLFLVQDASGAWTTTNAGVNPVEGDPSEADERRVGEATLATVRAELRAAR